MNEMSDVDVIKVNPDTDIRLSKEPPFKEITKAKKVQNLATSPNNAISKAPISIDGLIKEADDVKKVKEEADAGIDEIVQVSADQTKDLKEEIDEEMDDLLKKLDD